MNPVQQAVQETEITDLGDYIKVFSEHGDYRVSGLAKAAQQRFDTGDHETAKQWLVWAAGKIDG